MQNKKTVYLGVSGDFIHHGIINIINEAQKYGTLIIGCLNDKALAEHKRLPYLTYEKRKKILENIKGVDTVIEQSDWDYSVNIKKLKPDYLIHGDDWKSGPQALVRENSKKALEEYGGQLIEIQYTKDVSTSSLSEDYYKNRGAPEIRKGMLRRLIKSKKTIRIIEAHSPISALISEKMHYISDKVNRQFDGFWSSSLTDSTEMGKPDIELLDLSHRAKNISDIFEVTSKPMIVDLDTGGLPEHFIHSVNRLDRLGVSAVIIEDKTGLKKNSLFGNEVEQTQADMNEFANKIKIGKNSQISQDFMIIARIESLILEKGMNDALKRANKYVKCGADGIMIHSRQKNPDEILEFGKKFRVNFPDVPLICVPSSFNEIYSDDLSNAGFNIIIYANQLMRASYKAMYDTAYSILKHNRSKEIENKLISIKEILKLIPGTE